MKKILLLAATTLFLSQPVVAAKAVNWNAKSTEKQNGQIIGESNKSAAKQLTTQSASLISKVDTDVVNLNSAEVRQSENARILTSRPYVNTLDQAFWLYDAWVTFHLDADRDGFYSHFTVEFDADTQFNRAKVYARLYLARGDIFKEYHTTSDFMIYADSNNDSFAVESELLSGFPAADYEVLIELYDANTNQLVATLDGNNDADLYLLPLESENYEQVYIEPVVVVHKSGGGIGWFSLLILPFIVAKYWMKAASAKHD
ncbi:choice-of-anchor H family protein [Paraglaciecola aquimarina]|uniref:Choice-of-anchor H family protein n=1 Tax=Paraglaciecola aquimarina TaxID=1235557 RepID=A0ABU3SW39_9ALTE|nr:choice-of-anchor H family protein [Paraglaciecola aquimarina]MDU0354239.1 choice-of-anchor H family protein [Paraglaciecola aquimarina]